MNSPLASEVRPGAVTMVSAGTVRVPAGPAMVTVPPSEQEEAESPPPAE